MALLMCTENSNAFLSNSYTTGLNHASHMSTSQSVVGGPSIDLVWYVARRVAWAGAVIYAAMSAVFVLAVSTPDPEREAIRWAAHRRGEEAELAELPPLSERYVDWVLSFFTVEWGQSVRATRWTGEPGLGGEPASNATAVFEALQVTAVYVVPSTLFAFVLALASGYYVAGNRFSWTARFSSGLMYLLFSIPNFFLAALLAFTLRDREVSWFPAAYELESGLVDGSNLLWLVLPGIVLMTHLLAGYFRYARTEARESLGEPFVRFARSKGAGRVRVARHVFRKAALPLLTLFVTELLGILLVTIFVIEVVFEVPGIGFLAYDAVTNREIELVMVLTVLFSVVIVLSNLLQDLAAVVLDDRVEL